MRYFIILLTVFSIFRMPAQEEKAAQVYEPQHLPPEIHFSWIGACYGDTTRFVNATLRAGTYQWYIFDKQMTTLYSSTNIDISYNFPAADTFYVYLQADNGHIVSVMDTLLVDSTVAADFEFVPCSNQFVNRSYCATGYFWDFGDGSTATDSLPVHPYADTGTYVTTLVVNNGVISDTMVSSFYVGVLGFADPAFTLTLSNDTLYYQLNNYIPYTNVNWGFGDGGTSNMAQGYYIYTTSGSYYVNVTLINPCGIFIHDTLIQYVAPIGIQPFHRRQELLAYPNPSGTGVFNLEPATEIEVLVVQDVQGNIVANISGPAARATRALDLSALSNGQYFLRIITQENATVLRLVKQ